MSINICIVGSINMDLVVRTPRLPGPGETMRGGPFRTNPGGKGANQAVAAARLGAHVTFVGAAGSDDYGRSLQEMLQQEGIDAAHLMIRQGQSTGVGMIMVDTEGNNAIVVAPGANDLVSPSDIDNIADLIAEADMLLLQMEIPPAANERAIQIAESLGTRIMLNAAPARPLSPSLLAKVDFLVANETESRLLTGTDASVPDAAIASRITSMGPRIAVVTHGAEGATWCITDAAHHQDAFAVEAIDGTGAGDAFIAALAIAHAERDFDDQRLHESIRFASAAGALAAMREGAIPAMPNRKGVEQLLNR